MENQIRFLLDILSNHFFYREVWNIPKTGQL